MSDLDSSFWWATTESVRGGFFIYARGIEAATKAASEKGSVISLKTLPYPSKDLPPDDRFPQGFPAFCYSPQECAGNTSCPKRRACSE